MTSAEKPWLAHYAPGVVPTVAAVTESLPNIIDRTVKDFPNAVALDFLGAETRYSELGDQIARAAEGLRKLGVKRGDRVALVLPNCPEHIAAFYAVQRLGGIAVEHNPLYTERELRHQFEDHGARVAIVWQKVAQKVLDLPADLQVSTVISIDITRGLPASKRFAMRLPVKAAREARGRTWGPLPKGAIPWEKVLKSRRISDKVPRPQASDIAVIQYTSGTTGTPKGALLTHANLISNTLQCQAWIPDVKRGSGVVVYAMLPVFHAYGLTLGLTFAMSMAARLVLFPAFDPDLVLAAHKKHPATYLPAVPPIIDRLLKRAAEKKVSLRGVRVGVSGGMALDTSLIAKWEAATGGVLIEGYGLSETSPILMINPITDERHAGSIGLPVSSTEAKIVSRDDHETEQPTGEPGELLVRGPQVFSGYWKRPGETAAVLEDGWFRTGDIAKVDERGFFEIVDRIKELIITGGFNVAPSEVEEAVVALDGVQDAAAVGIPDPHSGEKIVVAVVMQPGAPFDPEAMRATLRENLTPYKVPREIVRLDELPRNMIGKVLRKKVREQLLHGEDQKA
ncbi:long-chain-fatty-acid--CoA ligase [Gryllotalpicola protaetiae]|uniref:Long-chain fatty acid--CoA ligase n=1 Tax=Gryllotalpicola protaetiae TaxID=2419771 RepID=A0A387BM57_9MICO|nr:long-chain-fatty-acid--CoA ligase [Gryllotalpicola protaetiae]AYG02100.1 long-chain fatty acid--CoA ligase [Gryllotalpicola protaetiae]